MNTPRRKKSGLPVAALPLLFALCIAAYVLTRLMQDSPGAAAPALPRLTVASVSQTITPEPSDELSEWMPSVPLPYDPVVHLEAPAAQLALALPSSDGPVQLRLRILEGDIEAAIKAASEIAGNATTPLPDVIEALRIQTIALCLAGDKPSALAPASLAASLSRPVAGKGLWLRCQLDAASLEIQTGDRPAAIRHLGLLMASMQADIENLPEIRTLMGAALLEERRFAEAQTELKAASILLERADVSATAPWIDCRGLLNRVLRALGEESASERLIGETMETLGSMPHGAARNTAMRRFAHHLLLGAQPSAAQPILSELLASARKSEPGTNLASALCDLISCYVIGGRVDAADGLSEELLALPTPASRLAARVFLAQLEGISSRLPPGQLSAGYLERIIEIRETSFPSEIEPLVGAIQRQGSVLSALGASAAAEAAFGKVLGLLGFRAADFPEQTAISCVNLGTISYSRGEKEKAADFFNRAVAAVGSSQLARSPSLVPAYDSLASMHETSGDLAAAEDFQRKSLDILQTQLGVDHPSVAVRLNNLGTMRHKRGDTPGAIAMYRKALFIADQSPGADDGSRETFCLNLIELAMESGDHLEAERLTLRLIAMKAASGGAAEPDIAKLYNNLAMWMESQGRTERAFFLYRQAVLVGYKFRKATKERSPYEKTCVANYSGILRSRGTSVPSLEKELNGLLREAGLL